MRVHSVSQGQLGYPLAVFLAEIVRNRVVVFCGVVVRLKAKCRERNSGNIFGSSPLDLGQRKNAEYIQLNQKIMDILYCLSDCMMDQIYWSHNHDN